MTYRCRGLKRTSYLVLGTRLAQQLHMSRHATPVREMTVRQPVAPILVSRQPEPTGTSQARSAACACPAVPSLRRQATPSIGRTLPARNRRTALIYADARLLRGMCNRHGLGGWKSSPPQHGVNALQTSSRGAKAAESADQPAACPRRRGCPRPIARPEPAALSVVFPFARAGRYVGRRRIWGRTPPHTAASALHPRSREPPGFRARRRCTAPPAPPSFDALRRCHRRSTAAKACAPSASTNLTPLPHLSQHRRRSFRHTPPSRHPACTCPRGRRPPLRSSPPPPPAPRHGAPGHQAQWRAAAGAV